jgi:hypothetical protein
LSVYLSYLNCLSSSTWFKRFLGSGDHPLFVNVHVVFSPYMFSYLFPDFLYNKCGTPFSSLRDACDNQVIHTPNYLHVGVGAFTHSNAVHVHSTPPDFQRSG